MSKTVYRTILTFVRPDVTVDFFATTPIMESKNEFRGLPEVDAVMQDLLQYNDDNAIVTSSEEVEVVTTQYD